MFSNSGMPSRLQSTTYIGSLFKSYFFYQSKFHGEHFVPHFDKLVQRAKKSTRSKTATNWKVRQLKANTDLTK